MKSIEASLNLLKEPKNIFITTHHKPDGDAVGSVMALTLYLRKKGHQVTPVFPSEVPDFLVWIPGLETAMNYEAESKNVELALSKAQYIFCLDFNDFDRVKSMALPLAASSSPKILIDHHLYPKPTFEYGVSDEHKSSTCEMVYDYIVADDGLELIDESIAACLYTGVMTDTGSFRFPACTASVHEMIAQLKHRGLKHSIIHEEIYDTWSEGRMRFLGYALAHKMEIFPQYNAGLIYVSQKDINDFGLQTGDTEGLVNYPLSIAGINFSTLIIERKDGVKMSFRSKGNVDVNAFARQYFNGGGHFNASGGQSSQEFTATIVRFKEILSEFHASNKK